MATFDFWLPASRTGWAMVWTPLAMGMLTGRYRKGRQSDSQRVKYAPKHLTGERKLDAVEQLIPIAEEAEVAGLYQAKCPDSHRSAGNRQNAAWTARCRGGVRSYVGELKLAHCERSP
jgi:hypothetical protein